MWLKVRWGIRVGVLHCNDGGKSHIQGPSLDLAAHPEFPKTRSSQPSAYVASDPLVGGWSAY
jgi:hypothetical protein